MLPTLVDLTERHREPELMDDPELDQFRHFQALRGLQRINRYSRASRVLWSEIVRIATTEPPLRILDVATGAGDVPVALARLAARKKVPLMVAGCDVSDRALEFARRRAEQSAVSVDFFQLDVLHEELPADFDIITCSLFLHHLEDRQVVSLLEKMRCAARRTVLISDLSRKDSSFLLAYLATRLLSRSEVVHVDGLLSVRAAFTQAEIASLAEQAGWTSYELRAQWPCRFLLKWTRNE